MTQLHLNDQVEVQPYGTKDWRPAVLVAHKPYHGKRGLICDGWDFLYTSGVEEQVSGIIPSRGGWSPSTSIRKLEVAA